MRKTIRAILARDSFVDDTNYLDGEVYVIWAHDHPLYVGMTRTGIEYRIHEHVYNSFRCNPRVREIIMLNAPESLSWEVEGISADPFTIADKEREIILELKPSVNILGAEENTPFPEWLKLPENEPEFVEDCKKASGYLYIPYKKRTI